MLLSGDIYLFLAISVSLLTTFVYFYLFSFRYVGLFQATFVFFWYIQYKRESLTFDKISSKGLNILNPVQHVISNWACEILGPGRKTSFPGKANTILAFIICTQYFIYTSLLESKPQKQTQRTVLSRQGKHHKAEQWTTYYRYFAEGSPKRHKTQHITDTRASMKQAQKTAKDGHSRKDKRKQHTAQICHHTQHKTYV